jgi:hypothetical protein
MRLIAKLVALIFVGVIVFTGTPNSKVNAEVTSNVFLSQRTTSVSKSSCPTAAQARIKAEKANPGWKVVNIKELSKVWHLTLKKE